jgi:hypothetical protein
MKWSEDTTDTRSSVLVSRQHALWETWAARAVTVRLETQRVASLLLHNGEKVNWSARFAKWILIWCISFGLLIYEGVSKSFRTESITKTTTNTHWEAIQRVMAVKLTRMTHEIATQLHLVAESCTICSSRSGRPVPELLDTPSYLMTSCPCL